jgi:glycosyltransferase involved in cell wall biosynthesis
MARILHILPYAKMFPPRNGGQLRGFHVLRELARENEVHAILLQPQSELQGERNGYTFPNRVRVYGPAQTPPPFTIFDLLSGKLNSALHYRWLCRSWRGPAEGTVLQIYHLLEDILRRVSIDVVIFEHLQGMMASPIVRRFSPQSTRILHAYNVDSDLHEQLLNACDKVTSADFSLLRNMRWLETNLHRFVDTFWACSEIDRAKLEAMNQERVRGFTVRTGVDTTILQYDDRPDKFGSREILFCGSLDYSPNRNGLLWFHKSIWPLVREPLPQVKLVVIGKGRTGSEFSSLRSDPSVDFVGEVESVVPYYRRCGCLIVPLLEGSGTRIKILEAMSLGNPVVSTRIGAEGIEAEHGREILLADKPEEFAAAISRLLGNQQLFDMMRRAGRRLVEQKYDWQSIGKEINRVIHEVTPNGEN